MANTYTTVQEVADDILIMFHENMAFMKLANTGYQDQFATGHWDRGDTIKVPKPNNFRVTSGATVSTVDDILERSVDLQITEREKIVTQFTTFDLTHYAKTHVQERFVAPVARNLADKAEGVLATAMKNSAYNWVGVAGTPPASAEYFAQTKAALNKLAIPTDHWMVMEEDSYASIAGIPALQNSNLVSLTEGISRRYMAGTLSDIQVLHSTHLPTHVAGVGDSSATPANGVVAAGNVKTTVTAGNTLVIENLQVSDTGVFLAGDKIEIAGVYSVSPIDPTRTTGELMKFTVLADANSDVSGETTITVSPAIVSDATSPYRNISNTAGIPGGVASAVSLATANTGVGSTVKVPYKINVAFHQDALLFAAPPLVIPKDATGARQVDRDTGISLRIIDYYDGDEDRNRTRVDLSFGYVVNGEYVVAAFG